MLLLPTLLSAQVDAQLLSKEDVASLCEQLSPRTIDRIENPVERTAQRQLWEKAKEEKLAGKYELAFAPGSFSFDNYSQEDGSLSITTLRPLFAFDGDLQVVLSDTELTKFQLTEKEAKGIFKLSQEGSLRLQVRFELDDSQEAFPACFYLPHAEAHTLFIRPLQVQLMVTDAEAVLASSSRPAPQKPPKLTFKLSCQRDCQKLLLNEESTLIAAQKEAFLACFSEAQSTQTMSVALSFEARKTQAQIKVQLSTAEQKSIECVEGLLGSLAWPQKVQRRILNLLIEKN